MKVDVKGKFNELRAGEFTEKKESVFVTGFVDDKYGAVKVYRAKRRMELRLKPRKWIEDKLVITFDMSDDKSSNDQEKLRGLSKARLLSHAKKRFESLVVEPLKS